MADYFIEASDTTTAGVDRQIDSLRKGLVKVLTDAKVDTKLGVTQQRFSGAFAIKDEKFNEELAQFTVREKEGWRELIAKAERKVESLDNYAATYSMRVGYDLSDEQIKVARGNGPAPAGYSTLGRTSELREFSSVLE